jgi:hypothetical protein
MQSSSVGHRVVLTAALALAVAALLSSCGPRVQGQAVVLWGPDAGPANGALLPVIGRSTIDSTVTLWDRAARARLTLEQWRVRVFPREAEAQALVTALASWRETYAFTDRSAGLPIREKADTQSRRVYKAAPGQLLRVLGKSADKSKEGIFEDYWYEVLTDDGYTGFCFGTFLRSFTSPQAQAKAKMQQMLADDPVLDSLLSEVWRPEYYADMIRTGRIDFAKLTSDIGLFPDRQAGQWKLVLPGFSATYRFDRTENPGPGVYTFPPSPLRIVVYPESRLEVSYPRDDKTTRTVFISVKDDVDEVITAERERRKELLDTFLSRGHVLKSTAFGTIEIQDDGTFRWTGFSRVPAGVFLRPVAGGGRADFPCRLAKTLEGSYEGTVSFVFDEYSSSEQTVFAYVFDPAGVQLTRIAPADIEDLEVKRVGSSPLVMYFTYQDR